MVNAIEVPIHGILSAQSFASNMTVYILHSHTDSRKAAVGGTTFNTHTRLLIAVASLASHPFL